MRLHRMPSISSYEACEKFYASARRWKSPARHGRDQIGEPKKIDAAGKEYKSLRQVRDARATGEVAYAWRYHDTDVVTWLTEDKIVVTPWASMSTTSFMEALLPSAFRVQMHHPLGCMLGVARGPSPVYPDAPASMWSLTGNAYAEAAKAHNLKVEAWQAAQKAWSASTRWFLVPENEPVTLRHTGEHWTVENYNNIQIPVVNGVKAHAARKHFDTTGFGAWLDAIFAMNPHASVRDAQAHAAARVSLHAEDLAENMHVNSDYGVQFLQEALLDPELYWGILAAPHLRPPQRYTRGGGRALGRTHAEEIQDWRAHMKSAALLAAYRKFEAVEVHTVSHLASLHEADKAHRAGLKWGVDYHKWPVVEAGDGDVQVKE